MPRSKGVKEQRLAIAISAAADRKRGLTWGQLGMKYNKDRNGLRRQVLKILSANSPHLYKMPLDS